MNDIFNILDKEDISMDKLSQDEQIRALALAAAAKAIGLYHSSEDGAIEEEYIDDRVISVANKFEKFIKYGLITQ